MQVMLKNKSTMKKKFIIACSVALFIVVASFMNDKLIRDAGEFLFYENVEALTRTESGLGALCVQSFVSYGGNERYIDCTKCPNGITVGTPYSYAFCRN